MLRIARSLVLLMFWRVSFDALASQSEIFVCHFPSSHEYQKNSNVKLWSAIRLRGAGASSTPNDSPNEGLPLASVDGAEDEEKNALIISTESANPRKRKSGTITLQPTKRSRPPTTSENERAIAGNDGAGATLDDGLKEDRDVSLIGLAEGTDDDDSDSKLSVQSQLHKPDTAHLASHKPRSDSSYIRKCLGILVTNVRAQRKELRKLRRAQRKELRKLRRNVMGVQKDVAELKGPTTPRTPAHHGAMTEEYLRSENCFQKSIRQRGPAVFSAPLNFAKECDLVAHCYKILKPLLEDRNRCLVSTENIKWMEVEPGMPDFDHKPHLILLPKAYLKFSPPLRSGVPCGVPVHKMFNKDVMIIDAKVISTTHAFGQLVIHLERLYLGAKRHSSLPPYVDIRGALISNAGIRLIRLVNTQAKHMLQVNWTTPGSQQSICNFFAAHRDDNTTIILNKLCTQMNLGLGEISAQSPQIFLGAGRFGRVFRVVQKSNLQECALKIVDGNTDADDLQQEGEMMGKVPSHMSVQFIQYMRVTSAKVNGAGLLMSPIGLAIPQANVRNYFSAAMELLFDLHQAGFCHGDPRVENMLLHKGEIIFCDFRDSVGSSLLAGKIRNDLKILLKSFKVCLTSRLKAAIEGHATNPSRASLNQIISLCRFDQGR